MVIGWGAGAVAGCDDATLSFSGRVVAADWVAADCVDATPSEGAVAGCDAGRVVGRSGFRWAARKSTFISRAVARCCSPWRTRTSSWNAARYGGCSSSFLSPPFFFRAGFVAGADGGVGFALRERLSVFASATAVSGSAEASMPASGDESSDADPGDLVPG